MQSFGSIFGEYLKGELLSFFENATVDDIKLDMESRTLRADIIGGVYIPYEKLSLAKREIADKLSLKKVQFEIKYDSTLLSNFAILDVISELKVKNAAVNGYFNECSCEYAENTATITLKYGGYDKLMEMGFDKTLKNEIKKQFGVLIDIKFDGVLETPDIEVLRPVVEKSAKNAPEKKPEKQKTPEKTVYNYKPKDGLPIYVESAKQFFGRTLKTDLKPIKNILPPTDAESGVPVCAWGEVFDSEIVSKPTKKGGIFVKAEFYISDGTNSICASLRKVFDSRYSADFEDDAKAFAKKISPIKDGACLIVNGVYSFDNWKNDFVLDVKAAATVEKYEETDTYDGEKRIELHCHTNMSVKDAVSSVSDIVKTAYKWGHKAIAITDHGVLQSFPVAAGTVSDIRKGGGDFKVIYGVEAYYIDDLKHDIKNRTAREMAHLRNHQIILVKNKVGLKNLYELVSDAHLRSYYGKPVTLRSDLDRLREGLIIGSACERGELYRAIVDGLDDKTLCEIADYYDYLEIQPLGNNEFMVRNSTLPDTTDKHGNVIKNRFRHVTDIEVIKNFNRKVVEIADKLGKPVVATGDVHFLKKSDGIIRQCIMAWQNFDDVEYQAPLYLKTTEEMLDDFSYFGDRAKEFVIDNPQKIAEMISPDIEPVPSKLHPPIIEGSDEELRRICQENAHRIYGEELPEIVKQRLDRELDAIISHGYSVMYMSAQKLVAYSESEGYLVGSRGSVGSSFAATMAGISEVNPLAPHYICENCKYSEFITDGSVGSGFDLPEKNCPVCGKPLNRDGHDIPFETFMGFKGDKVPDIDLNFSDEVQNKVQDYTKSLFGSENVFKAGTVSTVAKKTAYACALSYAEKMNLNLSKAELNRLADLVEKANVKTTTGQHPAGMIVVPRGESIYDYTPVQHPADDIKSDIVTTHFEFKYIHDTLLKLDELGHVVPTIYKYLEEYSGKPVTTVPMSDKAVYSLFVSPNALGVSAEDIDVETGTLCLPEFGTDMARNMLIDCKPATFADLLQISGLAHGRGVWVGNAKDLIDQKICTISNVIGTRDNIMVYLMHMGMSAERAFKITETVRKGAVHKGKISKEEWEKMEEDMRELGVPEWYIKSCAKIEYMFPKAHAAAYVVSALRIAWYKINRPLEFYCAYFTARPEDVDVKTVLKGRDAVKAEMARINSLGKEASDKEKSVAENLLIFNEMMARGIEVLPIDINHSHAVKYLPENGKMRLPFGALSGVGDAAAYGIYKAAKSGNFISREDFIREAGISKTVAEALAEMGALGDLPDTNQMTLF
ncbi:MAG: PolC-type DNA polymerase III [Clostridia bacterium]|nr:PolC-type DNA polymerase III [Clostridia bacterium]